ncbi:MAG: biotin--[acetyl-CoA-carboxylase] ligase [Rikenellaceae bacterium]|nr:biotin--[acetyl-CoA-carboxylase] ligase [Rikenellaceae bacterium]
MTAFRIHRFEELLSTNDDASEGKYSHGDVIVCRSQRRGRGQRGNGWHATPGENLTFSMVLEPRFLPAPEQFLLSMAVSLAAVDTLSGYGIQSLIKWPNDIYVGDRKIAGILIENDICGSTLSRSVAGVGLNVNETDFPAALPNPVSMAGISGRKFDTGEVLALFLDQFDARYRLMEEGSSEIILQDYGSLIYRKGIKAPFRLPSGERFEGTVAEVKPGGALVVESDRGREEFLFKEVEFIV